MGRGPRSPEIFMLPSAKSVALLEGDIGITVEGRGDDGLGGVFDHGTHEEDGPGTWEALVSPREEPATRRAGERLRRLIRRRVHGAGGEEQALVPEVGRWRGKTGAAAEGNKGVGGLHKSDDVGERSSVRTRPSEGGPC